MATNINTMTGGGNTVDYGKPALGPHWARLVGFCYIGVHDRPGYNGASADTPCGKIILTFELLDDSFTDEDGVTRPRWISKKENAFNTDQANIVKIYRTLDPTDQFQGDYAQLVANQTLCVLQLGPTNAGNVKITNIGPAPAGTQMPTVQNPTFIFDFDNPTLESWAALKNWMRKDISQAHGFEGSACQQVANQFAAQQQQQQASVNQQAAQTTQVPAPAPAVAQPQVQPNVAPAPSPAASAPIPAVPAAPNAAPVAPPSVAGNPLPAGSTPLPPGVPPAATAGGSQASPY